MDKKIKPKNKKKKKMILWGVPILLLLAIILMNLTRKSQINLKRMDMSIREVKSGDFEDVVLFNSTVEPKTSVLVNVIQGGSVSEIFVESGQMIKKGTPLLRVYNPNAELNYLTQETAIIEQINNLRNIRVSIKNQQLTLDQQLLSIDNDFKNAKRQHDLDKKLFNKGVVAQNDYQKTAQQFHFQKERKNVIKQSVNEEKKSRDTQLLRINTSITNMQKSLELLRKNKENFTVKAPVDGLLSSFNPILGENYNQGQPIGKVDVLDGYKLMAKVDEYYIAKLNEGIKGNVAINAKNYEIKLSKIQPEVVNGQFQIELQFQKDSLPKDVKRGMSLKSKVFLSNNSKALLIPKGQFYHSTNGKWVFVLSSDNKAVKRNVKIGRENPFYYEVLDGLKEGDKVITSNYDDFKNVEEINIQ
ncbi:MULTISPECIES: efflux RND transporter periplasmic adaptor subunit [unclassified Tenacibaculum]|uniref:efflux RND transporter periplasmic adaptor subunit n=1 Tax=unclassified Tenacibaculum TaxID=2635139 RepID=UPI001F29BEF7|nr:MULTISPECIES: HlyD family efflux transporter periplasmic adaptor subunit [unclassified Tenacibaculum]MCF2875688.1 HlyD family efflux transporter periplasmic adaptor subunit [Tenacibaculum sp. Cn5-1]MCF2935764.1 HlyD family efflux transporter periplasmic adaptor subunit [Tenacibaculum sp. Cn5-34]MCG7512324.1 HlyD family efflux transporter periplasmic adaptor subunit [Tenacibaculum sp. Cn5-46]